MSNNDAKTVILLVDDDVDFRGSVEIVLKKNNYLVLTADGVESACDTIKKQRVDLIISDLKMADGSGLDLLARTKKTII
ncbi:MAG: hypothetical protein CVT49_15325 [candidate division Zixibacteria bacterium HGW-Zixibacteria-1]|nr:MAG: hypothetical protein CVT49_15325 [candidate division Zixibacteria bacterium HGW-Zixibacteria-1]